MSRFFSEKYSELTPYTPGEQPRDMKYVKLNTNESPFAPCQAVIDAAASAAASYQLYPDPDCKALTDALAARYGVAPDEILLTNGSDEILNFAFMAFCDEKHPIAFADITYGFYPVAAQLNRIPYKTIPLKEDFTLDPEDYIGIGMNIAISNPNAPTGIAPLVSDIERIAVSNPDSVIIVDEAYVDFGTESAIPLTKKYDNILVAQTFSKSRSMAGARIGFGIGNKALIADLNTIKYSTNPYNISRASAAAGVAALENDDYFMNNCRIIMENRAWTVDRLKELGFDVLPSSSNFVFAQADWIEGGELYLALKSRGVLVRHFTLPRISNFVRITIGSIGQMQRLIEEITALRKERV